MRSGPMWSVWTKTSRLPLLSEDGRRRGRVCRPSSWDVGVLQAAAAYLAPSRTELWPEVSGHVPTPQALTTCPQDVEHQIEAIRTPYVYFKDVFGVRP
jgi:hypothetical protein